MGSEFQSFQLSAIDAMAPPADHSRKRKRPSEAAPSPSSSSPAPPTTSDRTPAANDIFERLPDDLLRHVYSLLPTDEAVRLSLLSRRRNRLWASLTALILPAGSFRSHSALANFIAGMLRSRDEQYPFKSISLSLHPFSDEPVIQDLLDYALRGGLRSLRISELSIKWPIPDSVFSSATLNKLVLRGPQTSCRLTIAWPSRSAVHMPALKKLELEELNLWDEDDGTGSHLQLGEMISSSCPALEVWVMTRCNLPETLAINCPRLESLDLKDFEGSHGVLDLDVIGPQLHRLAVRKSSAGGWRTSVRLSAPRLRNLEWENRAVDRFEAIDRLNYLEVADVGITALLLMSEANAPSADAMRLLKQLLHAVSTVTQLRLRADKSTLEVLSAMEKSEAYGLRPNLYGNLKKLEVDIQGRRWDRNHLQGFLCLLQRCPRLETLSIDATLIPKHEEWLEREDDGDDDNYDRERSCFCEADPRWSLDNLRRVRIEGFGGTRAERDFISDLVKAANSSTLQEMTVEPQERCDRRRRCSKMGEVKSS